MYRVQNSQADSKFDESAAIGLLQHLDKEVLEELNSSEEKMQGLLAEQVANQHYNFSSHVFVCQVNMFGNFR